MNTDAASNNKSGLELQNKRTPLEQLLRQQSRIPIQIEELRKEVRCLNVFAKLIHHTMQETATAHLLHDIEYLSTEIKRLRAVVLRIGGGMK